MFKSQYYFYPNFQRVESLEKLSDEKLKMYMQLLKFDMILNPYSYQSFVMYGHIHADLFMRQTETVYCKGTRVITDDMQGESAIAVKSMKIDHENHFDQELSSFANALYIMVSQIAYESNIDMSFLTQEIGFELVSKNWIERHKMLKRWEDSPTLKNASEVLNVMFKTVHLNLMSNTGGMESNVARTKLRNLLTLIGLNMMLLTFILLNSKLDIAVI